MSLSTILRMGAQSLKVQQAGLRAVSENISNVNTPGYVRKIVEQQTAVVGATGYGVELGSVRRAADIYLQRTSLDAGAEVGRAGAVSSFIDRAQILFGDPSEDTSFFKQLDDIFSSFATAAEDPTSNLRRSAAVSEVQRFFDDAGEISQNLTQLRSETDGRLQSVTDQVNGLLKEISQLNQSIRGALVRGEDATGAENAQSKLVDELATLMDIRVAPKPYGGLTIRSGDGTEIAGDGSATLLFDRTGAAGLLRVQPIDGLPQPFDAGLTGGELKGLMELRQTILPNISEQLAELTTRAADAMNKAHNANSAAPAPARMTGRDTGFGTDMTTVAAGFTGRTSINVMNAAGTETRRIDINFDAINATPAAAGGISINGVAQPAFGPGGFLAQLNTALGGGRSATFTGGVLTLNTTNPSEGFAIVDDPAAPSNRGGRGFSHYFGLNDLVVTNRPTYYETGLRGGDPHGFTPAPQTMTFRLTNADGGLVQDVNVAVPAGGTMNDLLTELNNPGGLGAYGSWTLDSQGGLSFTSNPAKPVILNVRTDNTSHGGPTGPSVSKFFGIGVEERATRAAQFKVRADIVQDPSKLAFAQLDYGAAVGARVLAKGDNDGAFALAEAGEKTMRFERAGEIGVLNMSVSRYASELGGVVGRTAANSAERKENAEMVAKEANARRASVEGVNMDEELIALTTYQQSYNAAARLIQAASEMYDTLVQMI